MEEERIYPAILICSAIFSLMNKTPSLMGTAFGQALSHSPHSLQIVRSSWANLRWEKERLSVVATKLGPGNLSLGRRRRAGQTISQEPQLMHPERRWSNFLSEVVRGTMPSFL